MNVKELKEYLNQCPDEATVLIAAKPKEILQLDSISCAITDDISIVTLFDTRYSSADGKEEKFTIVEV
jgi:hypothetical protein